ncbi:MAG: hypothetical protein HFE73_05190 [Firmicutes bacterium]|nr:hypothetical protein [Bacillota bacterium]
MDAIKIIAEYAGYISTVLALLTLMSKKIRGILIGYIDKKVNQSRKKDQLDTIHQIISELKTEMIDLKGEINIQKKINELEKDSIRCILRNTITHLYYKYSQHGSIPPLERENITYLYHAYISLEGNSYITQCYEEVMSLPVDNK